MHTKNIVFQTIFKGKLIYKTRGMVTRDSITPTIELYFKSMEIPRNLHFPTVQKPLFTHNNSSKSSCIRIVSKLSTQQQII